MMDIFTYLSEHAYVLQQKITEHVSLTIFSLFFASCIAFPIGLWIQNSKVFCQTILKIGSVSQTIPSLAMLAFLVPILGLGLVPTLVVLTFYAIYPILQATFTGLNNVPKECIEAADGLGFSTLNKLRFVELPLAIPVIISGFRVATAMTIGIATIAALIGAGGLGDFIMQGLSINDSSLILLGAIPTALLALTFDFCISQLEKQFKQRQTQNSRFKKYLFTLISCLILFSLGTTIANQFKGKSKNTIVIASKNFNEQNLLAEIISQLIENKSNLQVVRKFNLGTTAIVHEALLNGEIDLYPEYSGVAFETILKKERREKDFDIFNDIKTDYKKKFNLVWLDPFGFSNSQSLAVKRDFAKKHHIRSMSDLSSISQNLRIAASPDFSLRPDGLLGLTKVYHFKFKNVLQVDPNLMYTAIDNNQVDVIAAFTTDGKLLKHDLTVLKDDKNLYPSYLAAVVIRAPVLETYPQIYEVLKPLFGIFTDEKMTELNGQVEVEGKSPFEVARRFLSDLNQ